MLSGEMSMKWCYTLKITEPTIDRPTVQLPNKECLVQIRTTPTMGLMRITIIMKAVLTPGRYISRVMCASPCHRLPIKWIKTKAVRITNNNLYLSI